MENRSVLITGGNAGIGLATAIALAKQGANIYIVSRNQEKAEAAVKLINSASGNTNSGYFIANLSSQQSIRQLAEAVKTKFPVLDVLINNAGGVFPEFKKSEDGLEMTIATNHFAYFLLTNLLLDTIKKSDYARIVNVSSNSHYKGKIDFDSFTVDKGYFIMKSYEQSKLANVLFTQELAERLQGSHVTVNALHPGFVKTDIGTKGTQWYASWIWTMMARIGAISVEEGAKTSIYLASSDEVKDVSGKYFDKCKTREPNPLAGDMALQKKLWAESERWCGL